MNFSFLELKILPVVLVVIFAFIMWLACLLLPQLTILISANYMLAMLLFIVALFYGFSAIYSFRKATTTVNPVSPESASTLVTTGIFSYSRNPMYVALYFLLLSWAAILSNVLSLTISFLFILYMNRFQIKVEERALIKLFGEQYTDYLSRVRRWI